MSRAMVAAHGRWANGSNGSSGSKICVAVGAADAAHAHRSLVALARDGVRFVEVRIDYARDVRETLDALADFTARRPRVRVLATCRPRTCGGRFDGSGAEELDVLDAAVAAGAAAVDVALQTAERIGPRVQVLRRRTCVVTSYHDFEGTPRLDRIARRMRRAPADVCKIATTATRLADSVAVLRLPHLLSERPTVAVAMGELGVITRVLGPAWGSCWTYAAPDGDHLTAPGQISVDDLRSLYAVDALSSRSAVIAAVGSGREVYAYARRRNVAFRRDRADAVCVPVAVGLPITRDVLEMARALWLDAVVAVTARNGERTGVHHRAGHDEHRAAASGSHGIRACI